MTSYHAFSCLANKSDLVAPGVITLIKTFDPGARGLCDASLWIA